MNTAEDTWPHVHLTGIDALSRSDIETVHRYAGQFKATLERSQKKLPTLRGKTLLLLFAEPSTRTRVAFEIAAKRLGADVTIIEEQGSSLTKGESLRDTAEVIQALNVDLLVLRHRSAGAAHFLSRWMEIPVINAGDGAHEHPTQALLDTFTMGEQLGGLAGKRVCIVGDILHSRVARSNLMALKTLGAEVVLAGPPTLVPAGFAAMGAEIEHDLQSAVRDADVVMLLRIQYERQQTAPFPGLGEYRALYGLNEERLRAWLKPKAFIMHPGPVNRGAELDSAVASSPQSLILEQVTNGIVTRMAVLYLCMSAADYQRRKTAAEATS